MGLAAIAITPLRFEESRDPATRRPDWPGFATFSAGLAALVYGLIKSSADGWGSGLVVGCIVGAGLLFAAFVAIELRRREPMLDLGLLRVPTFVGGLTSAFAFSASLFSLLTFIVLPEITPHSMRRSWATFAASIGRDPKWIAARIGHTDPEFTFLGLSAGRHTP